MDIAADQDPLLDPEEMGRYLRTHRLPALHRFGQHFLVDAEIVRAMVEASESDPARPVIEIGAGLGVLTRALADAREHESGHTPSELAPVIAVELDRRLIPLLTERTKTCSSVRVLHGDILKISPEEILSAARSPRSTAYDVVGSIPYNITAPILKKFLAPIFHARRLTLLIDHAVAEAIAAGPPHLSVRAISVQVFAEPKIIRTRIPPSAFLPPPAVHSAIMVLDRRTQPLVRPEEERAFFRLVRAGFSQKRKVLSNALAAVYRLPPAEASARLRRAGIEPSRRAQTLSLDEWKRLLPIWERSPET